MGLTGSIVFIIVLFGFFVFFVWVARTVPAHQPIKIGASPAVAVAHELDGHVTPPKLSWNWWAFFLGPIWFLFEGLWVFSIILLLLIGLSGGILLPFTMIYAGAKANEALVDFRLARHSFY